MEPILLITPDLFWLARARSLLEARGYAVLAANSEPEVREALKGEVGGALLDLSAPRAREVLALLRRGVNSVPVLAFSGHTDREGLEYAASLGAKPVTRGEMANRLVALVEEAFGRP